MPFEKRGNNAGEREQMKWEGRDENLPRTRDPEFLEQSEEGGTPALQDATIATKHAHLRRDPQVPYVRRSQAYRIVEMNCF